MTPRERVAGCPGRSASSMATRAKPEPGHRCLLDQRWRAANHDFDDLRRARTCRLAGQNRLDPSVSSICNWRAAASNSSLLLEWESVRFVTRDAAAISSTSLRGRSLCGEIPGTPHRESDGAFVVRHVTHRPIVSAGKVYGLVSLQLHGIDLR